MVNLPNEILYCVRDESSCCRDYTIRDTSGKQMGRIEFIVSPVWGALSTNNYSIVPMALHLGGVSYSINRHNTLLHECWVLIDGENI